MEVPVACDYRDLRVWQDAMKLAESVYSVTRGFPSDERFGLTAQMQRVVVSVASCIAEGNARSSIRDYLRFLSMSSGSLAELETQMLLAERLGYVAARDAAAPLTALRSIARQLQSLKKALSGKLSGTSHFPVPRSSFPAP
ncbi:four helix bundle protein [Rhodanobacter spathiphylli]|uniref:four helix bundle protein n=1 Tax=Rhodanobacter spathiphylli TaxID=347483 RepID=UPI0012FB6E80|nr:four helix bundle protein [Rhodanobacter spathiphylli]